MSTPTQTKRYVLPCSSSNDNYDGGCEFALVELTPQFCQKTLKRIDLCKTLHEQDPDLLEMYYWDDVTFFGLHGDPDMHSSDTDDPTELGELLTDDQEFFDTFDIHTKYASLPDGFKIPAKMHCVTECDQMIVHYDGDVSWMCYPRHSDVTITTRQLPFEAFLATVLPLTDRKLMERLDATA